jgi:hypothetical protein
MTARFSATANALTKVRGAAPSNDHEGSAVVLHVDRALRSLHCPPDEWRWAESEPQP